jgi:hypothetical protein
MIKPFKNYFFRQAGKIRDLQIEAIFENARWFT